MSCCIVTDDSRVNERNNIDVETTAVVVVNSIKKVYLSYKTGNNFTSIASKNSYCQFECFEAVWCVYSGTDVRNCHVLVCIWLG